jgi:nicotinate-nucleotide pyrophosphorylase (carboxylating)
MVAASPASESCAETVLRALQEDHAFDDATAAAVVPAETVGRARMVAKQAGVLSGQRYADEAFRQLSPDGTFTWHTQDGDAVQVGDVVWEASAPARALLAAERTALNFLQQLSGVATLTAQAVAAADGAFTVLDTRKTVPGLRDAQKQAVVHGGGVNHRRDLSDQLLLKENHFGFSGMDYAATVAQAVKHAAGKPVGAESATLDEARAALAAGADYVLLDNFDAEELARAVGLLREEFPEGVLEVSGGLRPEDLGRLRALGIHRVSLGALTHSAPALDFSLLFDGPLS